MASKTASTKVPESAETLASQVTNSRLNQSSLLTTARGLLGAWPLSLVALGFLVSGPMAQATCLSCTMVIDEGVDLDHSELKSQVQKNTAELSGLAGVDDDNNGFIDDVAGWNALSNDGLYMPPKIKETFLRNKEFITKTFAVYSRFEMGDESARKELMENPQMANALGFLLTKSHGTHVAGIVSMASEKGAGLQSLNVFSPSKPQGPQALGRPLANRSADLIAAIRSSIRGLRNEDKHFFEDDEKIQAALKEIQESDAASGELLSQYVSTTGLGVANLSLGASKLNIREAIDNFWMQEQNRLGRDPFASRTPVQQANYDRLLNGVFASAKESWDILFRSNPQVLFVVAAGNDGGQTGVPDAGNNDINEVVPANSAMDFGNVITIAATTQAGVLADFSNFSSRSVSLGAWGKAVPSLAPADLKVVMSGTSMASPYVAGVASSIRRVNSKLSPQDVRMILEKTVRKTPSLQGKTITGGMVDSKAALAAARLALTTLDLQAAIEQALSARELLEGLGGLRILDIGDMDSAASQSVSRTDEWIKQLIRARSL